MTKTILLTGGAGYIGAHTYVALREAGYNVVIIDNFSNSKPIVLDRLARLTGDNRVECYKGSVLDEAFLASVFDAHNFDAVVHFAAKKAVGESVAQPISYLETNIGGLTALLKVMDASDVRALVFSSSATVYGDPDPKDLPLLETAPRQYTNPYGFTKLMSEQMLEQVAASNPAWAFGILRYFNPVGAHPSGRIGEDPSDLPNNLMPYIAKVAVEELPFLNVFGDDYDTPDGTGVRDYVHVSDLARGHVLSLTKLLETGKGHIVNLGTGQGSSVLDMLQSYSKACGRELAHQVAPRRDGDVASCYADVPLGRELLGFETHASLDEMCASSWHWMSTGAKEE